MTTRQILDSMTDKDQRTEVRGPGPKPDEYAVRIGSGWLCSPADPAAREYLRVVKANGSQACWDHDDFAKRPEESMNTLMGAIVELVSEPDAPRTCMAPKPGA